MMMRIPILIQRNIHTHHFSFKIPSSSYLFFLIWQNGVRRSNTSQLSMRSSRQQNVGMLMSVNISLYLPKNLSTSLILWIYPLQLNSDHFWGDAPHPLKRKLKTSTKISYYTFIIFIQKHRIYQNTDFFKNCSILWMKRMDSYCCSCVLKLSFLILGPHPFIWLMKLTIWQY